LERLQENHMANVPQNVRLEEPSSVDHNVVLGYRTGRSIPSQALSIGQEAAIRSGTVIYGGTTIGSGLNTGHNVVIREENTIGDNVSIWSNSHIDYGCHIGNNVKIHANVYVAQFTVIEDDAFLAPGVMIANDPHPLCEACTHEKAPQIRKGARIGVNVTILPDVVIGEYALVGAGSVVTKDVPAQAVIYGNPAQVAKSIDDLTCPHDPDKRAYVNGLDRNSRS
jgi:acetyltransferase-like isoleucine patch superfamily enzyme